MESAPLAGGTPDVLLRLFVTGSSQRSLRAIEAVEGMCKEFLGNGVRLEVVDVSETPDQAEHEKILATPTLIRQVPSPPRRLVGDMCEPERVIQLLGLKEYVRPRRAE
ncbi:MAG TPA: circadian clock KaiB family protein [Bryobacteraceae bacterium]|jgi:circadian clock protein KaiB|nr:circadian clock KaiB family protein [Bryobacteraceae bacterium]